MKFYIKKINHQFDTVEYKQYKCCDGFNQNKNTCWKFTKQAALKIIQRLKYEYRKNIDNLEFILEEAE